MPTEKRLREMFHPIYLIPSTVYAFLMVEGLYFENLIDIDFFSGTGLSLATCIFFWLVFTALYCLVFHLLEVLFTRLSRRNVDVARSRRILELFQEHPFATSFVFLLVVSLPLFILRYPGYITVDSTRQIAQGFNMQSYTPYVYGYEGYVGPVHRVGNLFNHHPIMHTFFLSNCVKLGRILFGSWNAGVFIYCILQTLLITAAYSYAIATLVEKAEARLSLVVMYALLLGLHPQLQIYLTLLSKDIIYTACFLSFTCSTYRFIKDFDSIAQRALWFGSIAGMILFRNDGFYLALPALLSSIVFGGHRKLAACGGVFALALFIAWNSFALPAMGVTPGGRREMLSIPLQQTARYLSEHPEDVKPEERAAIGAVLPYDDIADLYDPNISDPVKATFNEGATKEEFSAYLSSWYAMLHRHPDVYFRATIANKYQFFYPSSRYALKYMNEDIDSAAQYANEFLAELGTEFGSDGSFDAPRRFVDSVLNGFWGLPVIKLAISSYLYLLLAVFTIFLLLRRRLYRYLPLVVPFVMQMLVIVAGPSNGIDFRYAFPLAIVAPFVLIAVVSDSSELADNPGGAHFSEHYH